MGKREFFTGSVQVIADARLSGLDHRTYACVSMHDGMSLKKGSGRGCYATFATLTAAIGCDASNLSNSLKRLVMWGYLTEERQVDRRRKTYRVVFEFAEGWRNDQLSTSDPQKENGGEIANDLQKVVGRDDSGNGSFPPQDEQHYSSLKGLDTLERDKLDSSEEARFAARELPKTEFADNVVAQMARLERALKAGQKVNCLAWSEWLSEVGIDDDDNALRNHAGRIADLVMDAMTDAEYEQWGRDHGWVSASGEWDVDVDHPRGAAA